MSPSVPKPLWLSLPPFLQHWPMANIRVLAMGQALHRAYALASSILTPCGWICYSPQYESLRQIDLPRRSCLHSHMTQNPCSSLLRLALVLCFRWQIEEFVDHLEALCLGSDPSGTLIHLVNPAPARLSCPSHMALVHLEIR